MANLFTLALLVAFAVLILVGLAWLIAWQLGLIKPIPRGRRGEPLPYRLRTGILSPGEREFFPVLRVAVKTAWHAAGGGSATPPLVLASVRLAEVFEVTISRSNDRSRWQSAFNKIASKQADFILCDPESTRPLLIVELDDRSHARADRRERDGFLDDACAAAGLPILHIPAAARYDAGVVADQVRQALLSSAASPAPRGTPPQTAAR